MIRDPKRVREQLRRRILQGYRPSHTLESSEDFWTDWLALSAAEFSAVQRDALKEKTARDDGRSATTMP